MKPGWKTTEFWLSLVVVLYGVLLSSGILPEDSEVVRSIASFVAALSAVGYGWERMRVKIGEASKS